MTKRHAIRSGRIRRCTDEIRVTQLVKTLKKLQRLCIAALFSQSLKPFQPCGACNFLSRAFMVPSCSRTQEKAARAGKVQLERLAVYHRNKFESCIPNIFAFHYPRKL